MNKIHLTKFMELSVNVQNWTGSNIFNWWSQVFVGQLTCLPEAAVTRQELKKICRSPQYSDREVFAAVVAWGGMNRKSARSVVECLEDVCGIIGDLRSGKISREESYSRFFELRRARPKRIVGMGPAYFTKLIFFCSQYHNGYIMDQWTSKSINMIFGSRLVNLYGNGYVSDRNDTESYVNYCTSVEKLAEIGGWSPEETEIRLFSEGRRKGAWRNYVTENWVR